jgi:hypothetical protein
MPQTVRKKIFDSTATGVSPAFVTSRGDIASVADCRGYTVRAVELKVTGAGTPTVTVEVSPGIDTSGPPTTWAAGAARVPGAGAYAATPINAPSPGVLIHLDPSDYAPWIRLNVVTNPSAALVEAWVEMEV